VLTLMAEGLSSADRPERLVVSAKRSKHTRCSEARTEPEEGAHRRVLAVLTYLRGA
jgi:hypothetical protein